MLKIKHVKDYLSVKKIDDLVISDFSIITGLNGSGKTHFLKALDNGSLSIEGIDPSEIIFYNYNDFTVFNGDTNVDSGLKQREQKYVTKSGQFTQRVNQIRQQVLSSFNLGSYNKVISRSLPDHIYTDAHFTASLDWSEEEIKQYEQIVNNPDFNRSPHSYLQSMPRKAQILLDTLGVYEKIENIRTFLIELKSLTEKHIYLMLTRHLNYDIENIRDIINEYPKYQNLKQSNLSFDIWDESIQRNFSPKFLQFVDVLNMDPTFGYILERLQKNDDVYFNEVIENVEKLLIDIKDYFRNKIDSESLAYIIAINGENNLLRRISVESGFLNLHQITLAEKEYQAQKMENEFNEFQKRKGKNVSYLDDNLFEDTYGQSPIKALNDVLEEFDCNGYEFRQTQLHPDFRMGVNQQAISVNLYNKVGNYSTSLDALSSGEKTLMALAFYIYKLQKKKAIARLLLLDEIDSALHPSMSRRLINVLYNLFYKKMGIKIILSTHSPSTVAFAPNNSLIVMRSAGAKRFEGTTKDQALKELTTGVPSFSINYENRRQVFVESKYDVEYYEGLYSIYLSKLDSEVSLNFISSGDSEIDKNGMGKANCTQVIKIAKTLRQAGNKFIWGLIDWDLVNEPEEEYIKVLGEGNRYSMENYILDPLLLSILLWRERIVKPSFFGLESDVKFFEVTSFKPDELQIMIDTITRQVFKDQKADTQMTSYELVNGMMLKLPLFYATFQGHSLEAKILDTFPKLNSIKKDSELALKKAVIERVIADFSDLAPKDLLNVFKVIQQ